MSRAEGIPDVHAGEDVNWKGQTMRKIISISAALVMAAGAAGCGGDPAISTGSTPEPVATVSQGQPTQAPQVDTDELIEAFIEALSALDSPRTIRGGLDLTVEGSPAAGYLVHRANISEAALDGGISLPPHEVFRTGEGWRVCDSNNSCSIFTDFEVVDGKVAGFTVDGVDPGPRLALGNGETVSATGVEVEFLSAYAAISADELHITLRVNAGSHDLVLLSSLATYRSPDGRQRQATGAFGPFDLSAESTATVALVFAGVDPGGTVTFEGHAEQSLEDFSVQIRVG